MTDTDRMLLNAHALLLRLNGAAWTKADAKREVASCASQFPGTHWRLLTEEEPFRERQCFSILLEHGSPPQTISLSATAPDDLPWPLRGMQRWTSQELLRVNGRVMQIQQAIACVDFLWSERRIADRLIDVMLMEEAIEQQGIAIPDPEVQDCVDALRRGLGLYGADATHRWLAERGMTQQMFEQYACDQATVARLRRAVVESERNSGRPSEPIELAVATVAWLVVADVEQATGLCSSTENSDFLTRATDWLRKHHAGRLSIDTWTVGDEPRELVAPVLAAPIGTIVGPVRVKDGFAVATVLRTTRSPVDAASNAKIERLLFERWLRARRQEATIDWNWGKSSTEWRPWER